MGKGHDASDTNAKMTLGAGGITIFVAFITLILSFTIAPTYDPATFKACGDSSGAYKSNCAEVAWRRLATDALSQRTLSAPTNIAAVPTARDDIFSRWFDLNKIVGQLTTVKAAWNSLPTSKPSKKRLLAAHAATANDANTNDCATADNYYCDDPTKKQYSEYLTEKGAECATNTDTLDCKGPMKGSNCKAGECCCHDDMNAFSGSYIPPASEAEMSSYNQCGDCSTEFPIKCPTKYKCDNYMIESDWDVAVVVIDPYYGEGGCEKCCGQIKKDICTGREVQNDETVQATKAIGSYVMYGALLVVVGVAPALLAAFGKLKQTDANGNSQLENMCGTLSVFSTLCCGVIGAGAMAALLFIGGVIFTMYCNAAKESLAEHSDDFETACTTECKAVLDYDVKVVCDAGNMLGTASTLIAVSVVLSVITAMLVCIGFCNKKNKVQQVIVMQQQGGVQMQQMQGVQIVPAVPAQAVPVNMNAK